MRVWRLIFRLLMFHVLHHVSKLGFFPMSELIFHANNLSAVFIDIEIEQVEDLCVLC